MPTTKLHALATFVTNTAQLDSVISQILSLQKTKSKDKNASTLTVVYTDASVKNAPTIPMLKAKGFQIVWEQKE